VGFLLVRKAQSDPLLSRLAARKPQALRFALAGWGLVSALVLVTVYTQIWRDGKSAHPDFLSAVAPKEEVDMLAWMKANLPHDRLVLAPEPMAPWVAAIPMPSVGSHDLFSVTYQAQRDLARRFYQGQPERSELIDGFGISYVIAPSDAPIVLEHSLLIHQESSLRLYQVPGERMKPYPGIARLTGLSAPSGLLQRMVRMFGKVWKSA
jgi:hypothetical protein